jgi:ABC-type polysaccharide/polyol phosphate export permease
MLVFGVGVNAALGATLVTAGVDYNEFFLASVLAMASFGIASNTSSSFFLDRDNGIFFEMLTYPLSRSAYMLGKVLFTLLVSLVQTVITVVLAVALFHIHLRWDRVPFVFLAMIVGTAAWFFFYSIFALSTRRNDIFNTVTSILYFVFLFASNMFYPLEPLPKWFRGAALANPITWQIDCLRWGTIGLDTRSPNNGHRAPHLNLKGCNHLFITSRVRVAWPSRPASKPRRVSGPTTAPIACLVVTFRHQPDSNRATDRPKAAA